MTRSELVVVSSVWLLGCQGGEAPPPPRPTAVDPGFEFVTETPVLTIHGASFLVKAMHALDERESELDATYRAWAGTTELEAVEWIDDRTLRARVPPGIPAGVYDVAVEGPYGRGVLAGAFRVFDGSPAVLAATAGASPATASVGQTITVTLFVENTGGSSADVTPAIGVQGTAALVPTGTPGAQRIDPGGVGVFTWTYRADGRGDATLSPRAAGVDSTSGGPVSAPPASAPLLLPVLVQRRAQLEAALSIPAQIAPGEFVVTMAVANTGEASAVNVLPSVPASAPGGSAAARLVSTPPSAVTIWGGLRATYRWTFRTVAPGVLRLAASATGTDANDGGPCTASATSNDATIPEIAGVVAVDPFVDGSVFAYVTEALGQVYVGPNSTGTGVVAMSPDGAAPAPLELSFARDTISTGTTSTNTAPPYRSIGFTGCTKSSATNACGPDNEDGRGLFTSAVLGGEEWLVAGGARSGGDLDYVYMSLGTTSPLAFWYVDLSLLLGGNTRGFSAALSSGGRLYLGFPDNGGNRPYGIALLVPPVNPGLEARAGIDAIDLRLDEAFKAALGTFAPIAIVDAFAELNGRIYAFNNIGCIVSTTSAPTGPADFKGCSPVPSAAYDPKASLVPTRQYDLEPRDKAWPQVAAWNGRLFAIRNTSAGPQLWSCNPALGADPLACEPGDWGLVAADTAGLTRLGNPGSDAATLLVATPGNLYVGFDDPVAGVHVYRTSAAVPAAVSDFTGHDGCVVGTTGCQSIGGDGFGAPGVLTRIFDAKAIASAGGGTDVVLTAGDGTAPVRVIRIAE